MKCLYLLVVGDVVVDAAVVYITSTEPVVAGKSGELLTDTDGGEMRSLLATDGTVTVSAVADDTNDATESEVTVLAVIAVETSDVCTVCVPETGCELVIVLVTGSLEAAVFCC